MKGTKASTFKLKQKKCSECQFWYKADKVNGGLCSKCNEKFEAQFHKDIDETVEQFWNDPPAVQKLAATATEVMQEKSAHWEQVKAVFQEKLKQQVEVGLQEATVVSTLSGPTPPAFLAEKSKLGKDIYHCQTCGKGLSWAEMKATALALCSQCLPKPVVDLDVECPTVAPTPEVPALLAKSKYAQEKKAWVAELAKLAQEKFGEVVESEVSFQETSVPPGVPSIVHEPLKGKLEKGEPVVVFKPFEATDLGGPDIPFKEPLVFPDAPATSTTKPYPPPPPPPSHGLKTKPWKPKGKVKVKVGLKNIGTDLSALANVQVEGEGVPQKVRGMAVLPAVFPHTRTLEYAWFNTVVGIQGSKIGVWMNGGQVFLRPAPSVPQHGFIDSRPCKGTFSSERKKEALLLLKEVLERDPGGALIVCSYIPSRRNAVVTPVGITFGAGHDGATSGKNTITIPLIKGTMPIAKMARQLAGIGADEMPFVEVVFPDKFGAGPLTGVAEDTQGYAMPVVVQLRAGPQLPGDVDFIPGAMTVEAVYELGAEESMDEWPSKVKWFAKTPGLVVWHQGGSLQSHFGANAALAGVGYITSNKPAVGQKLVPRSGKGMAPSRDAFVGGFVRGLGEVLESQQARSDAVAFVLVVGHSVLALQQGDHAYYLGVACAFMVRLGMAASIGERRHSRQAKGEGKNRAQLFNEVLCMKGATVGKYVEFRKRMVEAHAAFEHESWPGGYGGKAWAKCVRATIMLDAAVMGVMYGAEVLERDGLAGVGIALHEAINQAHNNGWWLNKFAYTQMCDEAAVGSLSVVVQALRWFDVLTPLPEVVCGEWTLKAMKALEEGQVLMVETPARALAIREAQMRLDWNNEPLMVHVQYRCQGEKGEKYNRQDVLVTPDQSATLHQHCGGLVKGKSWGSDSMEYYPLEVYPGSNVVGVTLGGSVFFPLTALKGV